MKLNNFAIHQGKIVYVPDVPKEPITIPCNYKGTASPCTCAAEAFSRKANRDVVYYYDDNCPHRYKQALQSAIASGIEVENQAVILNALMKNGGREGNLDNNKLYPLQCRVEVIEEWIPGQGYKSPSKEIARVTFDQPEIKRVCNHDALIDTGVGYDVCPICNSSFPHIEPEAAGQEQDRVFDREDMAKAFVAGLLNRADFTIDEFSEQLKTAQVKIDRLCDFLIEVNKHLKS